VLVYIMVEAVRSRAEDLRDILEPAGRTLQAQRAPPRSLASAAARSSTAANMVGNETDVPWDDLPNMSRSAREQWLQWHLRRGMVQDIPPDDLQVEIGINFFKIYNLDLKASVLSLATWFRLEWKDHRLRYNASVWNITVTNMHITTDSIDESRIWAPDIELVNGEEGLSQTLSNKLAMVYPDGLVYYSRPGLLKTLCKFSGLENFPWDVLECELEFGAWALDGSIQDIIPAVSDQGITWEGKEGSYISPTQGSTFQDYTLTNIEVRRTVIYYADDGPPWPVLLYKLQLKRGAAFYVGKLVLPQVAMGMLSLVTYWMSPQVGERLGFGITLILAVVATEIVAVELMPVCGEILKMNWISWVSLAFCLFALFESAVVLWLYYLEVNDMQDLLPGWIQRIGQRGFTSRLGIISDFIPKRNPEKIRNQRLHAKLQQDLADKQTLRCRTVGQLKDGPATLGKAGTATQGKDGAEVATTATQGKDGAEVSPLFVPSGPCGEAGSKESNVVDTSSLNGTRPAPGASAAFAPKATSSQPRTSFGCEVLVDPFGSKAGRGVTPTESDYADEASDIVKLSGRLRRQLFRQAFHLLDEDFSGRLEPCEVNSFGLFMLGDDWSDDLLTEFMEMADLDNSGGLSFNEFSTFCEHQLLRTKEAGDVSYVSQMIKGFLHYNKQLHDHISAKWQSRAQSVDAWCKCLVPPTFFFTLLGISCADFGAAA